LIADELEGRIDSLLGAFRGEGPTEPLDVLDQITCLMFVR